MTESVGVGDRARDTESAAGDVVLVAGLREGLEGRIAEGVYVDAIMDTLDGWRSVEDVRDALELGALDSYFFPEGRLRPLDPYDVVPRVFWRRYAHRREAEREPTTTDADDLPRCPSCGGWRIRRKRDHYREQPNRKPGAWKCHNASCCHHFDAPEWPDPTADEDDEDEPATTEANL